MTIRMRVSHQTLMPFCLVQEQFIEIFVLVSPEVFCFLIRHITYPAVFSDVKEKVVMLFATKWMILRENLGLEGILW